MDEEGNVDLKRGEWTKFDATGPLNRLFIDWARKHYDYWIDKAGVFLKISKVAYLDEKGLRSAKRAW